MLYFLKIFSELLQKKPSIVHCASTPSTTNLYKKLQKLQAEQNENQEIKPKAYSSITESLGRVEAISFDEEFQDYKTNLHRLVKATIKEYIQENDDNVEEKKSAENYFHTLSRLNYTDLLNKLIKDVSPLARDGEFKNCRGLRDKLTQILLKQANVPYEMHERNIKTSKDAGIVALGAMLPAADCFETNEEEITRTYLQSYFNWLQMTPVVDIPALSREYSSNNLNVSVEEEMGGNPFILKRSP